MTYKKIEHFEPIAMNANFKQIKEMVKIFKKLDLPIYDTTLSCDFPYLINFYSNDNQLGIGTFYKDIAKEFYETFNAETFLKACGIVSEPLYQLTSKEVVHAYENPQYLKDTFKKCFETELEVGKWYKSDYPLLVFITEVRHHELVGYGFNAKEEYREGTFCTRADVRNKVDYDNFNFKPAAEKEVEEALKNYFEKTNGIKFNNYKFSSEYNRLIGWDGSVRHTLFDDGTWKKPPTYTISEAEYKFNIKIKAV